MHATSTGLALTGLDLSDCPSLAAALSRLEDFARQRGAVGVILGHGWDETRWPEGRAPDRSELDRASYGGVVYLSRVDVHSAVASSALLAAVPEARAMTGFAPTGLLALDAHHAVRAAALGSLTPRQRASAQQATLSRAAELGIGMLHELGGPDISSPEDFATMLALDDDRVDSAEAHPSTGRRWPRIVGYWGSSHATEACSVRSSSAHAGPPVTCSPTAPSARTPPACGAPMPTATRPGTATWTRTTSATTSWRAPRQASRPVSTSSVTVRWTPW